jgi:hypothetical protein
MMAPPTPQVSFCLRWLMKNVGNDWLGVGKNTEEE